LSGILLTPVQDLNVSVTKLGKISGATGDFKPLKSGHSGESRHIWRNLEPSTKKTDWVLHSKAGWQIVDIKEIATVKKASRSIRQVSGSGFPIQRGELGQL